MKEAEKPLGHTGELEGQRVEPWTVVVFDSVEQAVKEYQTKLHTPKLVTKVHQTIWREREGLVGLGFEVKVKPCPYAQEELADLEREGRRVGYLPRELAIQGNRHILDRIFPEMGSYCTKSFEKGNIVTNDENPYGWFDYEAGIDAPYLNTDEKQLAEEIAKGGRRLLNLNQYIVAGQDSKLLTGQYLDESRTWVRLGSRGEGRIINAHFYWFGRLGVFWLLDANDRYPDLGGRSSGVKKA